MISAEGSAVKKTFAESFGKRTRERVSPDQKRLKRLGSGKRLSGTKPLRKSPGKPSVPTPTTDGRLS